MMYCLCQLALDYQLSTNVKKQYIYSIAFATLLFFSLQFQKQNTNDAKSCRVPEIEIDAIKELCNQDYYNKVVLASQRFAFACVFMPTFNFYTWIHYTHPSAMHMQRMDFLRKLSEAPNKDIFAYALAYNKYDTIDCFIFENELNQITISEDNFPFTAVNSNLLIPDTLFRSQYFRKNINNLGFRSYTPLYSKIYNSSKTKQIGGKQSADFRRIQIMFKSHLSKEFFKDMKKINRKAYM